MAIFKGSRVLVFAAFLAAAQVVSLTPTSDLPLSSSTILSATNRPTRWPLQPGVAPSRSRSQKIDAPTTPTERCLPLCPLRNEPVCGSDGVTYSSACEMKRSQCLYYNPSDVYVFHKGRCGYGELDSCNVTCSSSSKLSICASNGITYDSMCLFEVAACKLKSISNHLSIRYYGECSFFHHISNWNSGSPGHSSSRTTSYTKSWTQTTLPPRGRSTVNPRWIWTTVQPHGRTTVPWWMRPAEPSRDSTTFYPRWMQTTEQPHGRTMFSWWRRTSEPPRGRTTSYIRWMQTTEPPRSRTTFYPRWMQTTEQPHGRTTFPWWRMTSEKPHGRTTFNPWWMQTSEPPRGRTTYYTRRMQTTEPPRSRTTFYPRWMQTTEQRHGRTTFPWWRSTSEPPHGRTTSYTRWMPTTEPPRSRTTFYPRWIQTTEPPRSRTTFYPRWIQTTEPPRSGTTFYPRWMQTTEQPHGRTTFPWWKMSSEPPRGRTTSYTRRMQTTEQQAGRTVTVPWSSISSVNPTGTPSICKFDCPAFKDPVCGSNEKTYENMCFLAKAVCESDTKVSLSSRGPCADVKAPVGFTAGSLLFPGSAQRKRVSGCSEGCIEVYAPVCGSDGKTYSNDCKLRRAACMSGTKVTLTSYGMCTTEKHTTEKPTASTEMRIQCYMFCPKLWDPICGSDGKTYANRCEMKAFACKTATSVSLLSVGVCPSVDIVRPSTETPVHLP